MINHCCRDMNGALREGKIAVKYLPQFREYVVESLSLERLCITMAHCPWCGTPLPKSLRDAFFDTLKKEYSLDLDILSLDQAPLDFQSDSWWKKRKL